MAYLPLDGPAVYGAISVTSTPIELKVGASVLDERKVVTFQPLDGDIYYGYDNSVSYTTGTKIIESQFFELEVASTLSIYLVAETGSINVRITEVA